ncbi:amidophosphoribosyltransferase, partial [bacterium]|nr:amidophosphoribosyltransferase [bacterium]
VVVEDSIVRGNTLNKLTQLLRSKGAKEVHIRVSSPPIRHPCHYGMDFPTRKELIAHDRTVEEVRDLLGVDSLGYLSVESLLNSVRREDGIDYCTACFTGDYPVPIEEEESKEQFEG